MRNKFRTKGDWDRLMKRLRKAEAEADATLGGMVRKMPPGANLRHGYLEHDGAEWLLFYGDEERFTAAGETPEQALAGREEE